MEILKPHSTNFEVLLCLVDKGFDRSSQGTKFGSCLLSFTFYQKPTLLDSYSFHFPFNMLPFI